MSKKIITLELTLQEYEHLITSIENARDEFEVLMSDISFYTTEAGERLETSLLLLQSQREGQ